MEPKEALKFLRQKGYKLSWDYTEVWGEAHHRTFTVAKVMKLDLLADIHKSLQHALKEGLPFKEWKKQLKPILIAKGWYGRVEVFNDQTGEFKTITVGSRRLKTIYETNIRSAYNCGRYKHLQKSGMPYWMYVSALLPTTRDAHRAMHGALYPKDHPFWNANYPPNGYNCKCKVRGYTEAMLKRRGITPRKEYETIAEVGFAQPPCAGLGDVWEEKILNAPDTIKSLARTEKDVSDMYDNAFSSDERLNTVMQAIKPDIVFSAEIDGEAAYSIRSGAILVGNKPITIATLRHESGHRLDHVYGWISKAMQSTVVIEGAMIKKKKKEIDSLLSSYEDDVQLQDLFYLNSSREVGKIETRRESVNITQVLKAKESFANFLQFYLLDDKTKLDIIKTYFPNSYKKFLQLLAKIKEGV
jgi:SPP1 gp7 family putative phage head morphogenesis protein